MLAAKCRLKPLKQDLRPSPGKKKGKQPAKAPQFSNSRWNRKSWPAMGISAKLCSQVSKTAQQASAVLKQQPWPLQERSNEYRPALLRAASSCLALSLDETAHEVTSPSDPF